MYLIENSKINKKLVFKVLDNQYFIRLLVNQT